MTGEFVQGRVAPAPAVTRSVRLLGVLAESRRPVTLTQLANLLQLPKSSTANLCAALEASDMIQRFPSGYRLGRRVAELGGAFVSQFNQIREFYGVCSASPILVEEVVQVAMLVDTDALYLARHEGRFLVRIGTPLGSRLPAALSATGQALLMQMSDAEVTGLLKGANAFTDASGRGRRNLPSLLSRLREARERGWTLDEGESFAGVYGVAVPLRAWSPGDPNFALGVAMPKSEATQTHVENVAEALQVAADALTNPFSERKQT